MPSGGPAIRYARYGALAFEFSGTIAAGAVVGSLVDRWLQVTPWGLISGTILAVVGGFIRLIQTLRYFDRLEREP